MSIAPNPSNATGPSNLKFPLNIGTASASEYKHRITFTAQKYNPSNGKTAPNGTVTLYMPAEALKTTYGQTYGDVELGAMGNLVSGMDSGKAQDLARQMGSGSDASVLRMRKTMESALGGDAGGRVAAALKESTAKATRDSVSGMFGGALGGATSALQNVLGQVRNPHKAVVYQGPGGFRNFGYTFTMMPENEAEADMIAEIVYFFKFHMHPGINGVTPDGSQTTSGTAASTGSSSFTYPDEWKIELRANGKGVKKPSASGKKPALFLIGKCFLENLDTDFTTSSAPAFFRGSGDGVPVTTTLALKFKETTLVTRNDIAKGY